MEKSIDSLNNFIESSTEAAKSYDITVQSMVSLMQRREARADRMFQLEQQKIETGEQCSTKFAKI